MSNSTTHHREQGAFPTATLVLGVGALGREVLRLLGERWSWIAQDNPDDPTLRHLRMLQLDPNDSKEWIDAERNERLLAQYEGDSREPEAALNFLILRTLGLVRCVDGAWEVACPEDAGAILLPADGYAEPTDDNETFDHANSLSELNATGWQHVIHTMTHYVKLPPHVEDTLKKEAPYVVPSPAAHPTPEDSDTPPDTASPDTSHARNEKQTARKDGEQSSRRMNRPTNGIFAGHSTFRLRYYRWVHLAQDPRDAAQRLDEMLRINGELARFIEPIVERVRDGNAPQILLVVLKRYKSWCKGLDPSPWGPSDERACAAELQHTIESYDRAIFGERVHVHDPHHPKSASSPPRPTELPRKPDFFESGSHAELVTPTHPWLLLSLNWETPGWTFRESATHSRIFRALPGSPKAFGFYDADARNNDPTRRLDTTAWYAHLEHRIQALSDDVLRALIRLWGRLTHLRQFSTSEYDEDHRGLRAATLHQSLELLGELIIRDVLEGTDFKEETEKFEAVSGARKTKEKPAPFERWDRVLHARATDDVDRFDERLRALGVLPEADLESSWELIHEFSMGLLPASTQKGANNDTVSIQSEPSLDHPTAHRLRQWINHQVRGLLATQTLSALPRPPGQMPLYMRIYIVGDLGERAVRLSIKPLLRLVHAELLRVVSPIYQDRIDGHTRPLTITPLLSMPHPADAVRAPVSDDVNDHRLEDVFGMTERRIAERLIIDTVHSTRRWVEQLPPDERLTHEVLVQGRITDRSVLSNEDSAEEIRAYVWMNARNALSDKQEINAFLNNRSPDVLSTFSCRELAFPGERARTWVANRYSRAMLHAFRGERTRHRTPILAPKPRVIRAEKSPQDHVREQWKNQAEDVARSLRDALQVRAEDNAADLLRTRFREDANHEHIALPVFDRSRQWMRERGTMDNHVRGFRDTLQKQQRQALAAEQAHTEQLMRLDLPKDGSQQVVAAMEARHTDQRRIYQRSRDDLSQAEIATTKAELPDPVKTTQGAWDALRKDIEGKPDQMPLWIGAVSFLFSFAIIIGPILISFAGQSNLVPWFHQLDDPQWAQERAAEAVALVLIGLLTFWIMHRYMQRSIISIDQRIQYLAEETQAMIEGPVATFFTTRLDLIQSVRTAALRHRILTRITEDQRLIQRVDDAARIRMRKLQADIEEKGASVRTSESKTFDIDDIENLFANKQATQDWLIPTDVLADWYSLETRTQSNDIPINVQHSVLRQVESPSKTRAILKAYFDRYPLQQVWRRSAPFREGKLIDFCAHLPDPAWQNLVDGQVLYDHELFSAAAGDAIIRFTARHFGTLGFGANFRGAEGMGANDIRVQHLTLLMGSDLAREVELQLDAHRIDNGDSTRDRTVDMHRNAEEILYDQQRHIVANQVQTEHLPNNANSVYLLMTAHGIRERSFKNLRRFMTVHDRTQLPEREHFPLSLTGSSFQDLSLQPLHHFSHQRSLDLREDSGRKKGEKH